LFRPVFENTEALKFRITFRNLVRTC